MGRLSHGHTSASSCSIQSQPLVAHRRCAPLHHDRHGHPRIDDDHRDWWAARKTRSPISWRRSSPRRITFATPLTLGALSGIYCERSGVVNIAIEGMMLGACFFGFIGASWFKSQGLPDQAALWLGVVVAMFTGFLFAAAARRAVDPFQGEPDHQRHGDQHSGRRLDGLPEPPVVLSAGRKPTRNRRAR